MSSARKNKFRETPVLESTYVEEKNEQLSIEEPELETEKKSRKKKTKENKKVAEQVDKTEDSNIIDRLKKLYHFYQSEQVQKITGLGLVLLGVYLCVAFTSYFFTGAADHDKMMAPREEYFSQATPIYNWLGKFGALISHFFIFKSFGLASFILVPVLIIHGLQKTLRKKLVSVKTFTAKWLFLLVWSSLFLSYFFSENHPFVGGGYGYFVNEYLVNYLGSIGLILLLGFALLTYLVITINLSFRLPAKEMEETETKEQEITLEENHTNVTTEEPISKEETERLLNFEVINTTEGKQVDEKGENLEEIPLNTVRELTTHTETTENKPEGDAAFEVKQTVEEVINPEEGNKAAQLVEEFGEYDPTLDLGSYTFPGFDLLNEYGSGHGKVNQEELVANKDRIINTLKNYGIEIEKIMATVGPTVTLYEIVPAAGVRISKIKNLEDDIALSLAALGIRIIAPIPGKGTIGIEVPNQSPEMVPMRNILASEKFNNSNFDLPIALGKTISNEIFIADLAKMPHLLMAGATGQGKSVGLNAVLVSLLYKKHPAQIKFVLVDPKKVELTLFNKIERHFLAKLPNAEEAIITDNTRVIHTLNSLCIEMDNRYALLQDAQVRNIKEYNAKFTQRKLNPNEGHKYLPYIVLVVDEFADLIMTAGKEVETPIARLAQLAKAVGIHLIIATQRPSVNIITGTIKANFPARIAFRVTSKIDSRTILDSGGAEQLIGRGDMLLSTGNDLIRIQCAFVDTPEVERITEFIGAQRAYPTAFMLPEYVGEDGGAGKDDIDLSERDKIFDDAAKLVVQFQQGSASFLQRKLKLGYNRAGRIVDQLEAAGIIGPFEGSKAREVLVKDMSQLEEILQKLRN